MKPGWEDFQSHASGQLKIFFRMTGCQHRRISQVAVSPAYISKIVTRVDAGSGFFNFTANSWVKFDQINVKSIDYHSHASPVASSAQ